MYLVQFSANQQSSYDSQLVFYFKSMHGSHLLVLEAQLNKKKDQLYRCPETYTAIKLTGNILKTAAAHALSINQSIGVPGKLRCIFL